MSKLPLCPYCNQAVEKNHPSKKYENRVYHNFCYIKMCEEKYQTQHLTPKGDYEKLYSYICELFNINELTPLITSQIKKMSEENKTITYSGILHTLQYFIEIKQGVIDPKYGIAIVPSVYDEARKYFQTRKLVRGHNKVAIATYKHETETRQIKPSTKKAKPFIDISKL